MWWRWLLVVLACLDAISSQLLTQQVSDARAPIECCPCPGSERAADALSSASQPTESAILNRETDADDCPGRGRDADSDGAPSLLFPRVLRPPGPKLNPDDKNADVKPLLHPEVDLASSVLETLRDATEEEYQEALARDAARNVARVSEDASGHDLADTANTDIVTIIVNPKAGEEEDIIISEASQVQESKCVLPLGSSVNKPGQLRSTAPLFPTKGLLRLPKIESKSFSRRPFNVHKSASNLEERVVSANRGLEGLKLKSSPSKLSEYLERAKSQILETSDIDSSKKDFISSKVPNFRLDSSLKKKNDLTGSKVNEKKPRVNPVDRHIFPKVNLGNDKTKILDSVSDLDSRTSPSNIHEQTTESFIQKPKKINLKSFLAKDIKNRSAHLKSVLKLKDVELISNKPKKTKIVLPSFRLIPFSQHTKESNEPTLSQPSCGRENKLETKIQMIPQKNEHSVTSVEDADISPSEYHSTFIETKRNLSEEHISDDVPDFGLGTTQENIGNDSIESSNRSGEACEEFENFTLDSGNENFEINEGEQESSEQKASSSREIIKHSSEVEGIESIELPREDTVQNEGNDSFVDSSNKAFSFTSKDNNHAMELEDKEEENKYKKYEESVEMKPNKKNAVPSLKEKMLLKLEDLKDDIAHIKNARQKYIKSAEIRDKDIPQYAAKRGGVDIQAGTTGLDMTTQEFFSTTENNVQNSTIDSLGENSGNLPKSSECFSPGQDTVAEPSESMRYNGDENTNINPSSSSSETTILDSVSLAPISQEKQQISESDLPNGSSILDIMNDQLNIDENSSENTFMTDTNENVEIKVDDSKPKEMSSQASESIFDVIPQPSGRQNIIVQPTSLYGENSLFRPLPSLFNLDGHLPTLDEIRSGLTGILGITAKGANDYNEISDELQSTEDCNSAMSTGASTTSSKSIIPNVRPLEDMNLDIFQLTPKLPKGLFQSRAPGLNLNSYKTKLAFPQNLGLKPLRLESSLGKNGNLLGATLTFGPERIGSPKSKMSRTSSILDHARVPILRNSLPSLHLDDIKTTMKARAEDLLSTPLSIAPSHTVQKVSELTDNLRSHTENTMKNIQQTLASSLSESRVKQIPLRGSFAKPNPEDLLEKLSTAREDMSDKLKALHADLADRISTIHENIAERTTLPTLQLPLFTPFNTYSNPKFRTRPKSHKKPKSAVSNMRSNSASNLRSSPSHRADEIKVRPFKISKAASTLTPKTVEVPKLMITSSRPPFAKPLQGDSNIKIKDGKTFHSSMTVDKKYISKNNLRANKNNPSSQSRPTLRQQFDNTRNIPRAPSAKAISRNTANLASKSRLADSRGFASELQPARVKLPKFGATVTERVDTIQTQIARSRPKPLFNNQNLGKLSQNSALATKSIIDKDSRILIHNPLAKGSDSPLLSKMRQSLSTRHSSKAGRTINNDDMSRSATENRAVELKQEPLKENVKYRCKMVCVREPIE